MNPLLNNFIQVIFFKSYFTGLHEHYINLLIGVLVHTTEMMQSGVLHFLLHHLSSSEIQTEACSVAP